MKIAHQQVSSLLNLEAALLNTEEGAPLLTLRFEARERL